MEKGKENLRVQGWVVVTACILLVLKMYAWYITRSVAILTDALESIVNVVAGFVGFYSLYIAAKPRDENHPYGHGKAEFLSSAVEGILIILAAIYIWYEAIRHLIYRTPVQRIDSGILIVALTAVINFVIGSIAIKRGQRNNSLALEATGRHLHSDTYSTIAIIIGLILIYVTGIHQLDSIIAIIVAIVISVIGYRIARRSVAGIMDEADEKILGDMVGWLNQNRQKNWIDIHNLRVIKFGSVLHVDCHLTVPWYFNVRESHAEIVNLTRLIQNKFGESMEFFVHSDDCVPQSCPICSKDDCPVRQHPFEKKIEWTLESIVPNQKHELPATT
ncbi:MAG: cation diffusion facilitator family transporter [Bacteroidetes bacterium]|nr:MAG: cation diffusion facilitator family transporter [Bacteroidota bacterium]